MPRKNYNGFKVPSKSGPRCTKCIPYMYDMIKEANPLLLENEDVKTAFNSFVECLQKYETLYYCNNRFKYNNGIKIRENTDENCVLNLHAINCRFSYDTEAYKLEIKTKHFKECKDVINHYEPLYHLIKRDVVPHMEIKRWEITSKKDIEHFHNLIEEGQENIKIYERSIETTRKLMAKHAESALALYSPPETTKFD